MWELFMFGSFGFWSLLVIASIILLYCAENDRGFLATVTVVGSLCLLNWCGNIPVFEYMFNNPWVILPGIAVYFFLGTLWAVTKWFLYVKDQRERYDELKQSFIEKNNLGIGVNDPIPDAQKEAWARAVSTSYNYDTGSYGSVIDVHPKVSKHKMRVYIWIVYFPWSLVWTIINDPVRKIFKRIYANIAGWLQSISDRYFKGTERDFK